MPVERHWRAAAGHGDRCLPAPCLNGGVCQDKFHDFACSCNYGWGGERCELAASARDACGSHPCQHGGRCIELGDNGVTLASGITTLRAERPVRCDCPDPYYGEYCELVPDACESQPCANGAACLRNGRWETLPTSHSLAHILQPTTHFRFASRVSTFPE